MRPDDWLKRRPEGLYVEPGGFFIDPTRAVDRAVITHGHSDHARPGHRQVLATAETLAIMRARLGPGAFDQSQTCRLGERVSIGGVELQLKPAGHILGSAQVVLDYRGCRVVISGDYKRQADPTCTGFELVRCDLFVTEATFGLPVFRHPPAAEEIGRILHALTLFPARCVVVGVYSLGKCQRMIALLRQAGHREPIVLHGALLPLCALYEDFGIPLGPLIPAAAGGEAMMRGKVVMAPPMALHDPWMRRLPDPISALASGWMRIHRRARQAGVELPLVISDHADWDELCETLIEVEAPEIWVTHGREEALVHYATGRGRRARALALVGYQEEADEPAALVSGGKSGAWTDPKDHERDAGR